MATATYWQRGETLDYVNSGDSDIDAGDIIVMGDRIAVAGCDIASGDTGSVHVVGVFKMALASALTADTAQGTACYIDSSGAVTFDSSDTVAGFLAADASSGDEEVYVKINA